MIEAFTKYSGMDITLDGTGDIDVDAHHLVEDVGLVVGVAVRHRPCGSRWHPPLRRGP